MFVATNADNAKSPNYYYLYMPTTPIPLPQTQNCRYGEAPPAAASWRDGRRQRGTACPLLYRYRLTTQNWYCKGVGDRANRQHCVEKDLRRAGCKASTRTGLYCTCDCGIRKSNKSEVNWTCKITRASSRLYLLRGSTSRQSSNSMSARTEVQTCACQARL